MKKVLFIVLLLVTAQTWAQEINTPRKNDQSSYGKYSMMQSASGDTVLEWVVASLWGGGFSETGVTYMRGASDTVGGAWVDTLSRKLVSSSSNNLATISNYWWQVSIVSDDTVEISTSAAFTAGTVVKVWPDIPINTPKLLYSGNTNLYIRKSSGVTGTPRYSIVYQGN